MQRFCCCTLNDVPVARSTSLSISQVKCYVNFFCAAGRTVKIDARQLSAMVRSPVSSCFCSVFRLCRRLLARCCCVVDPGSGSAGAHHLFASFAAAQVVDLTQRYDQLRLNEVRDTFAALQKEYGNAMSWLFSLRNSALFLALWREVAVKIMRQEVCLTLRHNLVNAAL
jgi:hypothetical protein